MDFEELTTAVGGARAVARTSVGAIIGTPVGAKARVTRFIGWLRFKVSGAAECRLTFKVSVVMDIFRVEACSSGESFHSGAFRNGVSFSAVTLG